MNPPTRALYTRSRRARTPGHQVHSQPWLIDAIGLLPDELRAKAVQKGTSSLPLSTRVQLVAGDAYVYLLWLLIPVLVCLGPLLVVYEIWRAVVFFFWRLGGLNPLAWEID